MNCWQRTHTASLEAAFIALLPQAKKRGHSEVLIPPLQASDDDIAIEAQDLTMRFGDFVAVDRVNFRIRRGEIFGFLGSNGCGKVHHHEDADRPDARQRRRGLAVRP